MSTGFSGIRFSLKPGRRVGSPGESKTLQTPIEKNRVHVFCCCLPVSKLPLYIFVTSKLFSKHRIYFIINLLLKINLELDINVSELYSLEKDSNLFLNLRLII